MNTHSENSVKPRTVALLWSSVAVAISFIANMEQVNASHHEHGSTRLHQFYIHQASGDGTLNGAYDENYCVQSRTTLLSDATAQAQIRDAINLAAPRWDGLNTGGGATDWRVDLWKAASACNLYSNKDWIEIEVHISKVNSQNPSKWCSENISCVSHYSPIYNSAGGHNDHRWQWVHLDYDNMSSTGSLVSRRVINHEFGHVLGLRDGDGSCSPTSLMHNLWYGCSYNNWPPTSADFGSVQHIASAID